MRKVILQNFVTIDMFAAGPKDNWDFMQGYEAPGHDSNFEADAEAFLDTVDTMMLGATTYMMFASSWPESKGVFAEKLNSLSKIVVSSRLKNAPWGKWEGAKITSDPAEKIAELKRRPGKDIVVWGSLTLAQSLMKDGLIDEYQLRVCPAIMGEGRKLFADDIAAPDMELLEAKPYDKGLVLLRYQPQTR